MRAYLNKPFPFIEKRKHQVIVSFLFSAFIYVFLIVFQPFEIDDIQFYKPLFVFGFFGITLIVLLISFLIAPYFLPQFFNVDQWTVKKNIIFISVQFIIIAILNWIYNSTIGLDITTQHSLYYFVFITISVGIIPTGFLIFFVERNLSQRNQSIALRFNDEIQHRNIENKAQDIIIIESENKDETVKIKLDQLMCVKSEGNYVNVFFKDKNIIKNKLVRNSISKIEDQTIIFDFIQRCHRSYIVNFDTVDRVSGNARNFNLHISDLGFTIPVSRSFPKKMLDKIDVK